MHFVLETQFSLNLLLTVGCLADVVFWLVFIIATLAAIVGKINWILMIIMLAITIGFHDTTLIGNAYVMFITTCLMELVLLFVWQRSILLAVAFLFFFGFIEDVYLSSALMKVLQGGWLSLVLFFIFMVIISIVLATWPRPQPWYCPSARNRTCVLRIGDMSACNILSLCDKSLNISHSVPHVSPEERFLIGRICPRPYQMYRCIMRYGYKDIQRDDGDFEN
ncbi:hypothetical protein ACSBR2_028753 [Camellia fascicularis]